MHNLLPTPVRRRNRVEYGVRLVTLMCIGVACAGVAGTAALVPPLVRVRSELDTTRALQERYITTDEQGGDSKRVLTEGTAILTLLTTNHAEDMFMDLVRSAMEDRPNDVRITGLSYGRDSNAFTIEGVASTRNALVSFVRTLKNDSHFVQVPDPLSDLARSANLPFRLVFRVAVPPHATEALP